MLNVYKNYGQLSGLLKFSLVWNPAWMLLEAFYVVAFHMLWPIAFVLLFGVFWALAIHFAQRELELAERRKKAEEEYQETLDRIFGRKDDAA